MPKTEAKRRGNGCCGHLQVKIDFHREIPEASYEEQIGTPTMNDPIVCEQEGIRATLDVASDPGFPAPAHSIRLPDDLFPSSPAFPSNLLP